MKWNRQCARGACVVRGLQIILLSSWLFHYLSSCYLSWSYAQNISWKY